jgi:transcriptional regulator with XRE-family HTH domain
LVFNIPEDDMDGIRSGIGGRIRKARRAAGMKNILEAAQTFGVSEGTWGNWERGDAFPGPEDLAAIAKTFNLSYDYLFTGETSPAIAEAQSPYLPSGQPLTEFEIRVIGMLRRIEEKERQKLLTLITNAYFDAMEGINPPQ